MGLNNNLAAEVKETFSKVWEVQKTDSVPAPEDLRLNANHAKDLEKATSALCGSGRFDQHG